MTLYKQIALITSMIIIILLSSVMVINYQSAKDDMLQSLYETTVNNISTLTSKLAEASDERALLVTTIDSEFDSGYYKMIHFESNDGKSDYKQIDNHPIEGVPLWFINFANIELQTVSADVSSGWSMIGRVHVQGDVAIVYKALYETFTKLFYLFIVFLSVTLTILSFLLRLVLKPLYRIQKQAEAILKNEFIIQEEMPYTTEFKDVVMGMNAMVRKVEDIFHKGNQAAQRNKELLYNDPTTKLFNRRYLMLKLPDLIKEENKTYGGTIIFIALSGAEVINQVLGRQKADEMFLEIAKDFNEVYKMFDSRVVARVNGTEFTLMLPDCEADEASQNAQRINEHFNKLIEINALDPKSVYINIGLYRYKPTVNIGDLLTRADNALSRAKAFEEDNICLYEEKDETNALGKEQWRSIIEESIEKNHFSLKFWPTLNAKTKKIDHKVMTFTIDGGENKKYFYGDFIAPAINLGLVSKMYIVALRDLITTKHEEIDDCLCSIRLSKEFINDPSSYNELSSLFSQYARTLNFKLSFEVTDTFAIKNTEAVEAFVRLFAKYGFGFGINSFTGESNDFTYLKQLNPAFLKADTAFLLDQSHDSMSAIQIMTDSLGIEIIATFVRTNEELEALQKMHINSVQGPVTDMLL
ncbi:EAL domain-containing protein [Sulfurimonas aquatica]|uniref:EAL domain-containing protein n=1 Tax=Sulfurimonas aquatica TaxID=2672570 RepID=A0A975GD87_9BACT|nr:EAL domain-containing protein [Sulfurimonas aquatica]QSZ42098.1 EAL domain-containing protein [Sulfurimonas aquatica]